MLCIFKTSLNSKSIQFFDLVLIEQFFREFSLRRKNILHVRLYQSSRAILLRRHLTNEQDDVLRWVTDSRYYPRLVIQILALLINHFFYPILTYLLILLVLILFLIYLLLLHSIVLLVFQHDLKVKEEDVKEKLKIGDQEDEYQGPEEEQEIDEEGIEDDR